MLKLFCLLDFFLLLGPIECPPDCSLWTEWSGDCGNNYCGHCSVQIRTRKANNNRCTLPLSDYRQCYNLACVASVPQVANCTPGCMSGCQLEHLPKGQARCKIAGTTIDPAKDIYNKSDRIQTPGKSCYPNMTACGLWTEWTGDCQTEYCGICNVQTRTRTKMNKCTGPLTASRQCLNLACRQGTQPNCFTGNGCAANCDWEVLNGTYLDGRFMNQARCKLLGSSIIVGVDDYQFWQNTTESETGKICHPSLKQCGDWTEWSGDCQTQYCGQCNVQTRTRVNINKCTLPLSDYRQCYNLACVANVPQVANCTPGCMSGCQLEHLPKGQARCKLAGTTIDPAKDIYNKKDRIKKPGKSCHPNMTACGLWTEWTGDCQTQYCGICNVQTRTRTNMNKCPGPLTDTRQCLNLACRATTQPECFSGSGCLPSCQFIELDADYAGGKFKGQTRCKTLGSTVNDTVDDYQLWMGTMETIAAKTCSPQLPKACGLWTEWTGDCQIQWCGQCNVQTRTRVNINKCTLPLKETRQCMNLACRLTTQPTCFTGTGCLPNCEWLQLNATYYAGRFKGQARCKLAGSTINVGVDDYQIWMNRTDTVSMKTCNPALKHPSSLG